VRIDIREERNQDIGQRWRGAAPTLDNEDHGMTTLLETPIRLALPYNHDPRYPQWLAAHRAGVAEVYLPLHVSSVGSGRPWTGPRDREEYHARLAELASVLRDGLLANIVVNLPVAASEHLPVLRGLEATLALFGRATVTVTDYPLAQAIRRSFAELDLTVSTLAEVDTVAAATYWRNSLGVRTIVLGRSINKRLPMIRQIRDLGVRITLVVDDHCLPSCPATAAHLALLAAGDPAGAGCLVGDLRKRQPWLIAQKDLVPANLAHYVGLIDCAKLEGRGKPLEFIERKLELYLAMTSLEHPYGYYREPAEAFARISECDRACHRCDFCARTLVPTDATPG